MVRRRSDSIPLSSSAAQPGWLKDYTEYAADANRSAAEIIDLVALKFSVSPRLFLALLEYQSGALTQPEATEADKTYPLGYRSRDRKGLYPQLLWTANLLNNGYYGWRTGRLLSIDFDDGRQMRFDPWQNAATVSLHNFFNTFLAKDAYENATSPQGLALTYAALFGDPWAADQPHIPGSLEQPYLKLPFNPGEVWAYTGGPHTAWGNGEPFAALDFAPPLTKQRLHPHRALGNCGCLRRGGALRIWRGHARSGWRWRRAHRLEYFLPARGYRSVAPHSAQYWRPETPSATPPARVEQSTGTHVHMARKYNGEWIEADWTLPFVMEDWIPHIGSAPYLGTLTRQSQVVTACDCSNQKSFIESDPKK